MAGPDQLKTEGMRRLTRAGVTFYGCLPYTLAGPLRSVKKIRGFEGTAELPIIRSAIRRIAWFGVRNFLETITVPPQSGIGFSFAEWLAVKIAEESGLPFVRLFENHNQGKRFHLAAKLKPLPLVFIREITGARILIFDDFAETRWTMSRAIQALRDEGNEVEGVVLA